MEDVKNLFYLVSFALANTVLNKEKFKKYRI